MNKDNPHHLLLITGIFALLALIFTILVLNNLNSVSSSQEKEISTTSKTNVIESSNQDEKNFVLDYGNIQVQEFITDKPTYKSAEEINFTIKIFSENDISNVVIKVSGIKPGKTEYISKIKTVNLQKGQNIVKLTAEAPNCTSGCGGIYPGRYEITAEVTIEGKILTDAKTAINLVDN